MKKIRNAEELAQWKSYHPDLEARWCSGPVLHLHNRLLILQECDHGKMLTRISSLGLVLIVVLHLSILFCQILPVNPGSPEYWTIEILRAVKSIVIGFILYIGLASWFYSLRKTSRKLIKDLESLQTYFDTSDEGLCRRSLTEIKEEFGAILVHKARMCLVAQGETQQEADVANSELKNAYDLGKRFGLVDEGGYRLYFNRAKSLTDD